MDKKNPIIIEAIRKKFLIKFNTEYNEYLFSTWIYGIPINDDKEGIKGLIMKKDGFSFFEVRFFFLEKISNIRIVSGDFFYPSIDYLNNWKRIFEKI